MILNILLLIGGLVLILLGANGLTDGASSVAKKWFYAYGKKRGVGVDIGVDKVRSFPIKPCPMEKQQEIALLVKTLIESDGLDETIDMQVDEFIQEIYGGE